MLSAFTPHIDRRECYHAACGQCSGYWTVDRLEKKHASANSVLGLSKAAERRAPRLQRQSKILAEHDDGRNQCLNTTTSSLLPDIVAPRRTSRLSNSQERSDVFEASLAVNLNKSARSPPIILRRSDWYFRKLILPRYLFNFVQPFSHLSILLGLKTASWLIRTELLPQSCTTIGRSMNDSRTLQSRLNTDSHPSLPYKFVELIKSVDIHLADIDETQNRNIELATRQSLSLNAILFMES